MVVLTGLVSAIWCVLRPQDITGQVTAIQAELHGHDLWGGTHTTRWVVRVGSQTDEVLLAFFGPYAL